MTVRRRFLPPFSLWGPLPRVMRVDRFRAGSLRYTFCRAYRLPVVHYLPCVTLLTDAHTPPAYLITPPATRALPAHLHRAHFLY